VEPSKGEARLAFGAFELDLTHPDLRKDGVRVPLHATPLRLLIYLVRHRERGVSKQELFDEVWPDAVVSDAALSSALKEVRRALGDDGTAQRFVATERGRGYRWLAPVEVRTPEARAAAARLATLPAPAPRARRVAVLPFKSLNAERDDQYFADGVTEDIVAHVSKLRGLSVVSSTSSSRFLGSTKSLREIAAELAVGFVVEGSVRREGRRVRIVSQLIDAESDSHLWAESYDRELADIFAIQQDVASRIAAALHAELSASERRQLARAPTRELLAYDLYLQGRQYYRRWQAEENDTAIALYRRAIERDPDFALAWAGLANALGLGVAIFGNGAHKLEDAIGAAERALTLDPSLAEAHKALGIAHLARGRLREALAATLRAVDLQPNYDEAIFNAARLLAELGSLDESLRWLKRLVQLRPQPPHLTASAYGVTLLELGFRDEGNEWIARARAFDPLLPSIAECVAREALLAGDYDAALRALEPALRPGRATAEVHELTGWIVLRRGDLAQAEVRFARAAAESGRASDSWPELGLAACARSRGELHACRDAVAPVVTAIETALASGDERAEQLHALAVAHALRGDAPAAAHALERAVAAGWRDWRWDTFDPGFDAVREHPGFAAVLGAMRASVAGMRERAERMAWHRPELPEPSAS
jgi:TolB-like protein/Tfp pilus assembly protein PilF